MFDDVSHIQEKALKEIVNADGIQELEVLRVKYLGRKGLLAELFQNIKSVSPQDKPQFGQALNALKQEIADQLQQKRQEFVSPSRRPSFNIDITADGIRPQLGRKHIISQTTEEICSIFEKMGFEIVTGPEVETEFNNFSGLNIPLEHPSRDTFDTFYLQTQISVSRQTWDPERERRTDKKAHSSSQRLLLRSHTSPVQIRVMNTRKPPLAVVVPGKVYRPDATDASHSFMFHQMEGFVVDRGISFSDLKGVLSVFAKSLFGPKIKMRFRPHFFPFTEPSAEMDISCIICSKDKSGHSSRCSVCGGKGWLEVLGAGMIHPAVFRNVGYSSGHYSGFAFGMGVERIAMLKYGINDIRLFFENDLRFLRQF